MAKKKGVKRARKSKRTKSVRSKEEKAASIKRKIKLVIKNLIIFASISLVSFILFKIVPSLVQNDFLREFFSIIAMISGFVASGFLIVLLILLIMRMVSSRR